MILSHEEIQGVIRLLRILERIEDRLLKDV